MIDLKEKKKQHSFSIPISQFLKKSSEELIWCLLKVKNDDMNQSESPWCKIKPMNDE